MVGVSGKVVHVNSGMPFDVYVGRANGRSGLQATPFQNPFKIGIDGDRRDVLDRFEGYARYCIEMGEGYEIWRGPEREAITYREAVAELRGKTLACWCAPKDRALTVEDETVCHAQILLKLAQEVSG